MNTSAALLLLAVVAVAMAVTSGSSMGDRSAMGDVATVEMKPEVRAVKSIASIVHDLKEFFHNLVKIHEFVRELLDKLKNQEGPQARTLKADIPDWLDEFLTNLGELVQSGIEELYELEKMISEGNLFDDVKEAVAKRINDLIGVTKEQIEKLIKEIGGKSIQSINGSDLEELVACIFQTLFSKIEEWLGLATPAAGGPASHGGLAVRSGAQHGPWQTTTEPTTPDWWVDHYDVTDPFSIS